MRQVARSVPFFDLGRSALDGSFDAQVKRRQLGFKEAKERRCRRNWRFDVLAGEKVCLGVTLTGLYAVMTEAFDLGDASPRYHVQVAGEVTAPKRLRKNLRIIQAMYDQDERVVGTLEARCDKGYVGFSVFDHWGSFVTPPVRVKIYCQVEEPFKWE